MNPDLRSILLSDLSTRCLSTRLKQNIQSMKELSNFFRRRAQLEEEQSKALMKTTSTLHESFQRGDIKQGSFSHACISSCSLQRRMADHSSLFAKSCLSTAEELTEAVKDFEKRRKTQKELASRADKFVHDAETARDKAKQRHESLVEEWDRSQGLDTSRKTAFSFKPGRNASTTKQLEELQARLEFAESDWRARIESAATHRLDLQKSIRPAHVASFMELISESDALLSLHLQRYARSLEDLSLGQSSLLISDGPEHAGMSTIIRSINDDSDFENFVESYRVEAETMSLPRDLHESTTPKQAISSSLQSPSLYEILQSEKSSVPWLVRTCAEHIEQYGLKVEGIYRISCTPNALDEVRGMLSARFKARDLSGLSPEVDINAVASVLKEYFRELPDTLIPADNQQEFIEAAMLQDDHRRRICIHQAINDLPDANYSTLRYLMLHLKKVETNAAMNLMTANNLAIIFGPTILGGQHIRDMNYKSLVIEIVLQHCDMIFEIDA